ncbi:16S rRNA (uracil(1498)-N(3))-methyltransferase [Roseofilum casamattae]|uniref:Ribosomal RNA small subunit methyltransferase E n=1 Tax=Roseofilum casamattae BLCC-M143 TaxID=3022442 RepID=A0ABT7BTY2_9CYAN|nr:16S rRNA (uracil(1498)-N(3))-methyltransferase [Roseofilum casamattae]MDJ1182540.1 16S rRNA (uracil(1498)-N(3))-methyltransferase [Roseofilum casamattae BLCC-M143]
MTQLQRLVIALEQLSGEEIRLTADQYRYLHRVLRLQTGDRFFAIIAGQWWLSELDGGQRAIRLEQIPIQTELPVSVTLIAALPKHGFDEVVRCCTELGVMKIVPVMSDRTLLKPSAQKVQRWRRIATEAAEQSERQTVPSIDEPLSFTQILHSEDYSSSSAYLCVARGQLPHLLAYELPPAGASMFVATGPEGGWTEKEIAGAIQVGFQPVSLGQRILRAVTAPIVVLSLIGGDCDRR